MEDARRKEAYRTEEAVREISEMNSNSDLSACWRFM